MATRQTRRQLQFTGFEMAMIGVSFVVTITVVFFLGLFVGKQNASHHAPTEDRVARIPVDDFTRYKRPEPIPRAPKEKPAAVAEAQAPAAAAAPAEAAKAAPAAPSVAAVPATILDAEPPAAQAAKPAPAAGKDETARDKEKEAADIAKEAAAKEAAAREKEKEKEPDLSTGRGYTVQILNTRKQADADALVRKLKSHGYAAYIKKVSEGEGAWYRVRVGSYGAFSEARAMADRCRREMGLGQAFVSTE